MSTAAACAVVLVSVAAILFLVAQARQEALEQEGQLLAASKLAEDEAQRRARAESQTAARERELKDAALAREQALARRARAAEIFRVGTEQAERARDITDPALRDATRAEAADTLQRATRADEAYMDPWFALARLHHFFFDPRALDCYGRVDQLARADGAPGDARSLVYAGDFARLYLRDTKAARDFSDRAGKIAPDDPLALVGRGYVELLDGDFGAALDLARRARELEGSLWEPYLLEGLVRASVFVHDDRALNRHFDPEQAEQLLTQGLLRNSREGVLYNERGTARLELGRIADALADFERACERMPGAVEPRVNVSIAMMRQARLGEALAMVEPLTAEFPRHVQVWMQYGTVLLMLSRYDEGILALNRSLELRPGRPAPLTNLSLAETWRGDYARAEQYAQQALAAEPEFPQAHIALCEARQGLKQYDAALQSAEAALALRPNWGVAEIARAKTLVMLGRFDDALGCARRAVKSQPEFDEAWAALGMAEQGLRNWPTAIEHHTRAVEINPRNSMARLNLAICLKMQGRVADALPHAEEACAQRALGARPHFEVASCLMLLGRTEQALARFLKAAEIEPTFGDAWINAALCANKLNRPKEARDHALQATRCRPDHVLSWVQLCQSEIYLKDFEAANRAVDKAKELATEDPAARCDVAAMLYTLGRNDEALAVAREVAALAEGYARPWELMANIHIRQKKFEDALKARAEQARRDPENPAPWVSSAALLYELGRHEEAVNAGKRALALDPNNAEAHNQIGHARQELKQYDLAIESYEAAARANKQDAWPWFNIGVARIRQNRIADAAAAFEQCVKVNPKNEKAQWTLGLCCKNLGRWPQAQAAFAAAFALNPRNAAAAQEAGIAAIENAEFETAQEFGHKASQLAPDQWLSWYVLGRAHFEQGQHASAAKALNKAVALETKTPTLYRLLAVAQSELAEYEAARQAAEKCLALDPKDADSPLVLARVALAHDNKPEVALAWLRKALENGADREFVVSRPWAAPLHDSDGWKQLLKDFPG
ncbi:MAG: tetratricopeptide repeat protein [Planctomycetes bacterium]|nr:tetratricopeptide repeat protein [Planctomycetota bacterium]